jgi:hypothetical protein
MVKHKQTQILGLHFPFYSFYEFTVFTQTHKTLEYTSLSEK